MTWKPIFEAHAIERVRVQFHFKEPIPSKLLTSATTNVTSKYRALGFTQVTEAESGVATFKIIVGGRPTQEEPEQNGVSLKRIEGGDTVEDVAYRDTVFAYVSKSYDRWHNLLNRLEDLLFTELRAVSDVTELSSIKLEYWDSFRFDGTADEADISSLLEDFQSSLPNESVAGGSTWHSHAGWFEINRGMPVLVNKNFDSVDREVDGDKCRFLGIYTLLEQRSADTMIEFSKIEEILEHLHQRSIVLFGSSLTEPYRKMIGLDLESYK
jgi:uncharacterized protein (TIGR04255 family)